MRLGRGTLRGLRENSSSRSRCARPLGTPASASRAPTSTGWWSAGTMCHGELRMTAKHSTGMRPTVRVSYRNFTPLPLTCPFHNLKLNHWSCDTDCARCGRGQRGESVIPGWFTAGSVLGIAVDLDSGTLFCTACGRGGWISCFQSGLRPGATVGNALLLAVTCADGARVRCNSGIDPSRPMRHDPPSSLYRPFGADAGGQVRHHTQNPHGV